MGLTDCLLLVLLLANVQSSVTRKMNIGCTLQVPDRVKNRMEPINYKLNKLKKPLPVLTDMKVLGVRDVPDNGGSYGVDIR